MSPGTEGPRGPSLRLFVAVELPGSWTEAIGRLQEELRAALGPAIRLRWVRPEAIHLTLKFIGPAPESQRRTIESALDQAVPQAPNLTLRLDRLGTFGARRAPRVVWVGLKGDIDGVQKLAARIDACLDGAGIPREKRPLAPHLTLARVPEGFPPEELGPFDAALAAAVVQPAPPFTVERVSLMQSHLGAGGARYERLAAFPGQGASAPGRLPFRAPPYGDRELY